MTGARQVKGDRHERAVTEALVPVVAPFELLVERQTRAGYNRDAGDIHVLTADRRTVLATLQCKDWAQTTWRLPEWLGDLDRQRMFAHADHGALVLKRARTADAAHCYALSELHEYGRLLGEVARLRAEVARLRGGRPSAPTAPVRSFEHLMARPPVSS